MHTWTHWEVPGFMLHCLDMAGFPVWGSIFRSILRWWRWAWSLWTWGFGLRQLCKRRIRDGSGSLPFLDTHRVLLNRSSLVLFWGGRGAVPRTRLVQFLLPLLGLGGDGSDAHFRCGARRARRVLPFATEALPLAEERLFRTLSFGHSGVGCPHSFHLRKIGWKLELKRIQFPFFEVCLYFSSSRVSSAPPCHREGER